MTRRISIGFSWLLSWALLVTLAGGKETWIKADTENFEIYSSASEAKSRALLEDLEQFRATLLKVMKLPPGHEPRTTIVLFDRASDFERYQPLYQGKPKEVSGYFSRGEDLAMMALSPNTRDEDRVRRVIFHEYLHQLLATHGLARIPVWLNEGLAEFFSTFQYEKGRAIIGRPLEAQLIFLNQVAWLPLQAVLAAKMDSPEYNEDFRNSVFYAQAWALVHYLLCAKDTDYAPLLNRYLAQAAQPGQVAMPDFVDFTQIDVDDLAKRLRRYTKTGRYSPYKIDESAVRPNFTGNLVFSVPAAQELDCVLALLAWRARQAADSNYRLLELAEQMPDPTRAEEALGSIAWQQQDERSMREHWARAIAQGSTNAFIHRQLAVNQVTQILNNRDPEYRLPEAMAMDLRTKLNRAVELDPDYADPLAWLAVVEAFAERPDIGNINRAQRSVAKQSDPRKLQLGLALVRWRLGDKTTPKVLAEELAKATDDPTIVYYAQWLKQQIEMQGRP